MHCLDISAYKWVKDEGVIVVVYYDGDMVSSFEQVLFECPNGLKSIKMSWHSLSLNYIFFIYKV